MFSCLGKQRFKIEHCKTFTTESVKVTDNDLVSQYLPVLSSTDGH